MSTSIFLVAHPQKTVFEVGGSWMHDLPEDSLLSRETLYEAVSARVRRPKPYVDWLVDSLWEQVIEAGWDVSLVLEPGHDRYLEQGYRRVGTYFPLRSAP
jgi:hypothetical protein